jgi:hypothetical protein
MFISQHFVSPVHSLDDFVRSKIYIIDHNPSWKENQRHKRESFWIREIQTWHPKGKNILFPTWIVVNDIYFGSDKVIQWVHLRHKVLTHGQERLFCMVTSVSIHSFVEWLDTFSYVLRPADVTDKKVHHIRCFVIAIAKDLILLSCRLAMEHLCVLQLETALATKEWMDTEVTLRKRRSCPWVNTLCRPGTHWMTLVDPKYISLTTIQVV